MARETQREQHFSTEPSLPIPGVVSVPLFLITFFFAGGALALWVDVWLAERGPSSLRAVFIFIASGLLTLHIAKVVAAATLSTENPMVTIGVLFGVVLPTLVYVFLTTIWLLKLVRSAMPR